MEIGGNEDKSTFVYLTARRPCPSASDLDQWMVLPVVYDKSTLSQASEKNGGEMFLLAHVPTLKEMIFAHEMHEILANKYSHGSTASQQVAAPTNPPITDLLAAFRCMLHMCNQKACLETIAAIQTLDHSIRDVTNRHVEQKEFCISRDASCPANNAAYADSASGAELSQTTGSSTAEWPSSGGNKMSQSVGNEYAAGCTQQENSRMQHFLCVACGGRYRSRRHLYFHKRQVHDNNAIVCNICGKPLKNQSAFIKHRKCHWGAADLPYLCSICTRGFKEKCHLVAHCRNKHHEEVDVDAEMDGQAPPEEQCF